MNYSEQQPPGVSPIVGTEIKPKVFVDGTQGVRVPMREVALSKGERPIRLYDTSGPQDHDVKNGLPKLSEEWINARLRSAKASAERSGAGRVVKDCDAIFFGVTQEAQLARIEKLKASLKPNGALWIIRPKGCPEISERATMAAGKGSAGLVDVKVVRFSATHTAEKLVIPLAARGGTSPSARR